MKSLASAFYEFAVRAARGYQRTSFDILRIEAVKCYLNIVKAARHEHLISALLVFGIVAYMNFLGVLETAVLLYAPWAIRWRIAAAAGLGIGLSVPPVLVILRIFSHKRWLKISMADRLMANAFEANGRLADGK